jgi:glycosyltransferase involved in cell wall biosynthesis
MRALRVVHLVEALGTGGLERVVQSLARHAKERGLDVQVLCAVRAGPLAAEIEASSVPVRVLGLTGYRPRDILRAARVLGEIDPDIIHTHGHFAGVLGRAAAWWAGLPISVHHLHTIDTTLRRRHRRMERFLARLTDRVICCSRAVAEHARLDLGIPESLVLIVPNGIEPMSCVTPGAALAKIGRPAKPVIGCIGSLTPHKGQSILLRSLEHLPCDRPLPTIVLIGDGPERAVLEALAAALPRRPRVLFLGERQDARALLPAFDLLVVPSLEREGFGLAAIEGMDAGVPVIASRVGGLPEVVEEGRTGILVPPGDATALAQAIAGLLDRPETGRALGAEGRRSVQESFRASIMARLIENLYEEAMDARRAA